MTFPSQSKSFVRAAIAGAGTVTRCGTKFKIERHQIQTLFSHNGIKNQFLRGFSVAAHLDKNSWATVDPDKLNKDNVHRMANLAGGKWLETTKYADVVDPLNGHVFMQMPDTSQGEVGPFVESLSLVPKTGLHNPLKNPERYNQYAEISHKAAVALDDPEIEDFFIKCIQRVMPKSRTQAYNEIAVTRTFLKTFAGDMVRFTARGFMVAGDHAGQESKGYRFPFGPVALIAPFNFPFEIPVLQLMGCLFMGNKPVVKGSEKTSMVLEQYIRLLHACGMPLEDVDLIHSHGDTMEHLIKSAPIRLTQFTGSSMVAERLSLVTHGKVKIEDAGFDWKILGPDAANQNLDYVAWVCDQDAYAMSGQKCSAQSIMFTHSNWMKRGILGKIESLATRRSLEDLTISPVLSVTTERIKEHVDQLLKIPGAYVVFGGEELEKHNIPKCYGAVKPTAVFVPLEEMLRNKENFELCTTEIFGPFQVITEYDDSSVDRVIEACERMSHHLTAAVVSSDIAFQHKILSNTVNGTTYTGIRARTTGAPANHWFGPSNDPRGAGIGSPEAILLVWTSHREIIEDRLPPPDSWTTPPPT
uniref:Aldehyde dehydrogenase domain-containing protein n=1 Tax=Aplanochytrium stocchinoi TaxID=215587 RepID=A0A7S3LJU0_9STRA|mmetsp:Transcript_14332/g.16646  ORF Transcript_14332/g.16646 Transcript_14332/m.16646 type:complete len:585 (+) Transcript_14332:162-1916(+)